MAKRTELEQPNLWHQEKIPSLSNRTNGTDDTKNHTNDEMKNKTNGSHKVISTTAEPTGTKNDTYQSVFEKFSTRPRNNTSFLSIVSSALVVGQEFILTVLLWISHKVIPTTISKIFKTTTATTTTASRHTMLTESNNDDTENHTNFWTSEQLAYSTSIFGLVLLLSTLHYQSTLTRNGSPVVKNKKKNHDDNNIDIDVIAMNFGTCIKMSLLACAIQYFPSSSLFSSNNDLHALVFTMLFFHLLFSTDYDYLCGIPTEKNTKTKTNDASYSSSISSWISKLCFSYTELLRPILIATTLLASKLERMLDMMVFAYFSMFVFTVYPTIRHRIAANTFYTRNHKWGKEVVSFRFILFRFVSLCLSFKVHAQIYIPVLLSNILSFSYDKFSYSSFFLKT